MHWWQLRWRQRQGRFACAAAALLVATLTLGAQTPRGEIRVQVKDPSGAAMEASGTLENLTAGGQRSFQTNAQGTYTLDNLPYGRYRLEISRTGFVTQVVSIDVQSRRPISRLVTMALTSQTFKTDVVSATPLAGTDLTTEQIASPVQTANAADIEQSGALEL